MCLYKKHVLEGGALWNLPTQPLVVFPFSFVTMKVHIKDEHFSTPAFFVSGRPLPVIWLSKKIGVGGSGPFVDIF